MRKVWVFILGIVTGIVLMFVFSVIYVKCDSGRNSSEEITLFEEVGDCVSNNSFKVLQVLESGAALAIENTGYLTKVLQVLDFETTLATENKDCLTSGSLTVLFLNEGGQSYYDDQIIEIPAGKCARQVGIFKYLTKGNHDATVPVVIIR